MDIEKSWKAVLVVGIIASLGIGWFAHGYSSGTVEPNWAKTYREKLVVIRGTDPWVDPEQTLSLEFVGLGGYSSKTSETWEWANYVGWRETGYDKGDLDATIGIGRKVGSESMYFAVWGYGLKVIYDGEVLMANDYMSGLELFQWWSWQVDSEGTIKPFELMPR